MPTITGQPESYVASLRGDRYIPRCHHIRPSGEQCGSPALKNKRLCYFHSRIRRLRPASPLPILEDANSVQLALMQVIRGLTEKTIDHRTAGLLLYALQTAAINLRNVRFEPRVAEDVVFDLAGAVPHDVQEQGPPLRLAIRAARDCVAQQPRTRDLLAVRNAIAAATQPPRPPRQHSKVSAKKPVASAAPVVPVVFGQPLPATAFATEAQSNTMPRSHDGRPSGPHPQNDLMTRRTDDPMS